MQGEARANVLPHAALLRPQITHLVIGSERRTLKLMLAVANGAWLVSPQWVTASLEAGRWLPESQFPAKVGAWAVRVKGWVPPGWRSETAGCCV